MGFLDRVFGKRSKQKSETGPVTPSTSSPAPLHGPGTAPYNDELSRHDPGEREVVSANRTSARTSVAERSPTPPPDVRSLVGHTDEVTAIAFYPDGSTLVSVDTEAFILWDTATGRILRRITGLPRVTQVSFSADRRIAVLYSLRYDSLETWDLETGARIAKHVDADLTSGSTEAWRRQVTLKSGLSVSPDGALVTSGCHRQAPSDENGIRVWHARSLAPVREFGWRYGGSASAFLPDSRTLLASTDGLVLWNAETGKEKGKFASSSGKGTNISLASDGLTAVTTSGADIHVWDVQARLERTRIVDSAFEAGASAPIDKRICSLAVSPDGLLVAVATFATDGVGVVRLYNTLTGKQVHQFVHRGRSVNAMAFSTTGRHIAAGDTSGAVIIEPLPESIFAATDNTMAIEFANTELMAKQEMEAQVADLESAMRSLDSLRVLELLRTHAHLAHADTRPAPLYWAAENGFADLVEALLDLGVAVSAKHTGIETALHVASRYGHNSTVRLLLQRGADVHALDSSDWTPLHQAAAGHNSKSLDQSAKVGVIVQLLAAGAAVDQKSSDTTGIDGSHQRGVTAIDVALGWGYNDIARTLRAHSRE